MKKTIFTLLTTITLIGCGGAKPAVESYCQTAISKIDSCAQGAFSTNEERQAWGESCIQNGYDGAFGSSDEEIKASEDFLKSNSCADIESQL